MTAAHRPTSAAQAAATKAGTVAAPEQLDADTFVVPMSTGIPFVVSTLCYVLLDRDGAAHVIDPGIPSEDNLDLLLSEIRSRGVDRIASVTATHMHPDHLGLAPLVRERTGAELRFGAVESGSTETTWRTRAGRRNALDEWGVPADDRDELLAVGDSKLSSEGLDVDVRIGDGDDLDVPGRSIRAMVTPGHTPGHLCFIEAERGRVFTGDHVLPHINPGLGLGHPFDENPVHVGVEALEAVAALDGHALDDPGRQTPTDGDRMLEALPGHGYRFLGLRSRADEIASHHNARTAEVAAILERTPIASDWETALQIGWTAGWDGLSGFHRLSALAQTAMHVDRVRSGLA
ncbi:MAG: MBL fold metallo-hydrolase [Pseudoclavibacter sp.]